MPAGENDSWNRQCREPPMITDGPVFAKRDKTERAWKINSGRIFSQMMPTMILGRFRPLSLLWRAVLFCHDSCDANFTNAVPDHRKDWSAEECKLAGLMAGSHRLQSRVIAAVQKQTVRRSIYLWNSMQFNFYANRAKENVSNGEMVFFLTKSLKHPI